MDFQITIKSVLDFIIILILIFGIFRGYTQGFIVQSISLFALLAGIYIGVNLSMAFYNLIVDKSNVPLRNLPVIVFFFLFMAAFFCSNWVGIYVKKVVTPVKVNIYARVTGAFFGLIKYLFVSSIILIFLQRLDTSFNFVDKSVIENKSKSMLYDPVVLFAPMIIPKLNFDIKQPSPVELDDFTDEPEYIEELDELDE